MKERTCVNCSKAIPPDKRKDSVYCSPVCGRKVRYRRYYLNNPETILKRRVKEAEQLEKKILSRIKSRANKKGIAFDLTIDDITVPDKCPVLGIPIVYGYVGGRRGYLPNSPSVDRLDPKRGYVKGNIRVISARANLLKNDATIEELEKVIGDLRALLCC